MIEGLMGKKIGMTHLFGAEARVVPVTVLEVGPCVVTQVRTEARDGYDAVQLGYGAARQLSKPAAGHLAASGARVRRLREFKADDVARYRVGQRLRVTQFQPGDLVDVVSTTKGRGFQGVMRRHGFGGGQKTHGQGDRARAVGSIGAGTYPGRVLKGKKMPGHMGNARKTVRKLRVEMVDAERNLLLVRGPVPGAPNTAVMVRYAHGVPMAERLLPEESMVEEPARVEERETAAAEPAVADAVPPEAEAPAAQAETPAAETAPPDDAATPTAIEASVEDAGPTPDAESGERARPVDGESGPSGEERA